MRSVRFGLVTALTVSLVAPLAVTALGSPIPFQPVSGPVAMDQGEPAISWQIDVVDLQADTVSLRSGDHPTPPSPAPPSAGASPAATFDVFAESPVTTVSLGLYSGLPDPSWVLSDEEAEALDALLESLPRVEGSAPSGGLGYHGFSIERLTPQGMPRLLVAFQGTVSDPASSSLAYLDDPERSIERFLLETGRDQLSSAEIMGPGLDPPPAASPPS